LSNRANAGVGGKFGLTLAGKRRQSGAKREETPAPTPSLGFVYFQPGSAIRRRIQGEIAKSNSRRPTGRSLHSSRGFLGVRTTAKARDFFRAFSRGYSAVGGGRAVGNLTWPFRGLRRGESLKRRKFWRIYGIGIPGGSTGPGERHFPPADRRRAPLAAKWRSSSSAKRYCPGEIRFIRKSKFC